MEVSGQGLWSQNMDPDDRSLPSWIETCYEELEPQILREEGLSFERAKAILTEAPIADEELLEPADIDYAIQRLLERGYLYEVHGSVFVTEPEFDSESDSDSTSESESE